MASSVRVSGSFRDPSGFVFTRDGEYYRQVNRSYSECYDRLMGSGLYDALVGQGLLVPHRESDERSPEPQDAYKVLAPERIPFVSYPYEWCFSQLKDAALATLKIQQHAMRFGMTLKDSSAYNIQFLRGKPVLLDTLSFDLYREGQIWVPYRQFCQHFLAPLALMSYTDVRLSQLLRVNMDGLPLDLASRLLPRRTWLRAGLLMHLHLHAGTQRRYAGRAVDVRKRKLGRMAFEGLIDSLASATRKLAWQPGGTEWGDYYDSTNYTESAQQHKCELVGAFLDRLQPRTVWDLGANTGRFSRIASARQIETIAFDVDPSCVERNYLQCVESRDDHLLPLLLDLTNPSPGIGWQNQERLSLIERGPADTVVALALIHHLAISNNVPLAQVAAFLSNLCSSLIIEFVPKDDSQVQRLLSTREDVFPEYIEGAFARAFARYFAIEEGVKLRETDRTLYLMRRKEPRL